ncbi:MAG: hypothetical protein QOJ64_1449 [Acidobacteriota bacterium]|jgi:hypothetical protein|nr:hypothetical protein [Acidobacteriota bacterium]
MQSLSEACAKSERPLNQLSRWTMERLKSRNQSSNDSIDSGLPISVCGNRIRPHQSVLVILQLNEENI